MKKIELIKKCILNHWGSRLKEKTFPEETCVADSDAMAHFYSIPAFSCMVYKEKGLSIDEGRQLVKKQYDSAKEVLR